MVKNTKNINIISKIFNMKLNELANMLILPYFCIATLNIIFFVIEKNYIFLSLLLFLTTLTILTYKLIAINQEKYIKIGGATLYLLYFITFYVGIEIDNIFPTLVAILATSLLLNDIFKINKSNQKILKKCLYEMNCEDFNPEIFNFFCKNIKYLDNTDKIKLLYVAKEFKKRDWVKTILKKEPIISHLSGEVDILTDFISDGDILDYEVIKEYGVFDEQKKPYVPQNSHIMNFKDLLIKLEEKNNFITLKQVYKEKSQDILFINKLKEEMSKGYIELYNYLNLNCEVKNKDKSNKTEKIFKI